MFSILGVDSSLTATGMCRLDFQESDTWQEEVRLSGRKGKAGEPLQDRWKRREAILGDFRAMAKGCDLIVIEGPSYAAQGGLAHDRSGLWWGIVAEGLLVCPVIEVAPKQRVKYILGKGGGKGTDKDYVLAAAIKRYPSIEIVNNNVADAVILAAVGARFLGCPIESSSIAAMDEVVETLTNAR